MQGFHGFCPWGGLHTRGWLKKMGSVVGLKTPEWANTPRSPNPQERGGGKSINKKTKQRQDCKAGAFAEGWAEVFIRSRNRDGFRSWHHQLTSLVQSTERVEGWGGRLGGLQWRKDRRRRLLRALQMGENTLLPWRHQGYCLWLHKGLPYASGSRGQRTGSQFDVIISPKFHGLDLQANTRFPFPPYVTLRTTRTCSGQCTYVTSHMQAGGGWLGHLRVHIQYTYLWKKIHSWLQLRSGWRHAVRRRRHTCPDVSPNLAGWAESRPSPSFSGYIKLLHCSNTDRRWRWSKRRLQMR